MQMEFISYSHLKNQAAGRLRKISAGNVDFLNMRRKTCGGFRHVDFLQAMRR